MTSPAPTAALARRLDWAAADASERSRWIVELRASRDAVDVAPIIDEVRQRGDAAVRELTLRLDGAAVDGLWVDEVEIDEAVRAVEDGLAIAIDASIAAVRRFHADQRNALRDRGVV